MAHFGSRLISSTVLLTSVVVFATNCGRTAHDEEEGPLSSSPAGAASQGHSSGGGAGGTRLAGPAGSSTASSGSGSSRAGAPAHLDPTSSRPCEANEVPGAPCEAPRCWGTRCGVRYDLVCQDSTWKSGDSGLAWVLSCPVPSDSVYDIRDIEQGACCGEILPRNDVHSEPPSCNLCPELTPRDGEPCSLPADCAPPVIDCFYKCCCYGTLTWAQCDGQRWRVATNCSGK